MQTREVRHRRAPGRVPWLGGVGVSREGSPGISEAPWGAEAEPIPWAAWGRIGRAGCRAFRGAEGGAETVQGLERGEQGLLTQRPSEKDAGERTEGLVPQHGRGSIRKPAVTASGRRKSH